jgi:hypothetical protein
MAGRALAVFLLTALASGCGADAATTVRALASWTATSAMIGEAWADGATPRAYTEGTLERAREALSDKRQQLGTLPSAPRIAAMPVVERVDQRARQLTDAIRTGDRRSARLLANALAEEADALQKIADSVKQP